MYFSQICKSRFLRAQTKLQKFLEKIETLTEYREHNKKAPIKLTEEEEAEWKCEAEES